MDIFLATCRPCSVNGKSTATFKRLIGEAFKKYSSGVALAPPLYGIVYYFHARKTQIDADNLSKPVWDALEGLAFADDSVVKLRHAGIVDLSSEEIASFDMSRVPDTVLNDLYAVVGTEDHVLFKK